jgi:hypothetical protein
MAGNNVAEDIESQYHIKSWSIKILKKSFPFLIRYVRGQLPDQLFVRSVSEPRQDLTQPAKNHPVILNPIANQSACNES